MVSKTSQNNVIEHVYDGLVGLCMTISSRMHLLQKQVIVFLRCKITNILHSRILSAIFATHNLYCKCDVKAQNNLFTNIYIGKKETQHESVSSENYVKALGNKLVIC